MATAFADLYGFVPAFEAQVGMAISVTYVGSDVPNSILIETVQFSMADDASPAVIRQSMADAIRTDATARGLSLGPSSINLPTFQKG